MKAGIFCFACCLVLYGTTPLHADDDLNAVKAYLAGKPELILCATYAVTGTDSLKRELIQRKLLNDTDLEALSKKSVKKGVSECAVLVLYRFPKSIGTAGKYWDKDHEGVADKVYYYGKDVDGPYPLDIYVSNGRVVEVIQELTVILR